MKQANTQRPHPYMQTTNLHRQDPVLDLENMNIQMV